MDPLAAAARLAANAQVFQHLLSGVAEPQARWKPAPEKWSLLEVINHLADEERLDFRARLDLTLNRPGERWPPIDPVGWVGERGYNRRELGESLADFLTERARSVEWLHGLAGRSLNAEYDHPRGKITALELLGSWLAHDLIHIRQLTRLHYEYLASEMGAETLGYAGPW